MARERFVTGAHGNLIEFYPGIPFGSKQKAQTQAFLQVFFKLAPAVGRRFLLLHVSTWGLRRKKPFWGCPILDRRQRATGRLEPEPRPGVELMGPRPWWIWIDQG